MLPDGYSVLEHGGPAGDRGRGHGFSKFDVLVGKNDPGESGCRVGGPAGFIDGGGATERGGVPSVASKRVISRRGVWL